MFKRCYVLDVYMEDRVMYHLRDRNHLVDGSISNVLARIVVSGDFLANLLLRKDEFLDFCNRGFVRRVEQELPDDLEGVSNAQGLALRLVKDFVDNVSVYLNEKVGDNCGGVVWPVLSWPEVPVVGFSYEFLDSVFNCYRSTMNSDLSELYSFIEDDDLLSFLGASKKFLKYNVDSLEREVSKLRNIRDVEDDCHYWLASEECNLEHYSTCLRIVNTDDGVSTKNVLFAYLSEQKCFCD
jgi:hypothetical protein